MEYANLECTVYLQGSDKVKYVIIRPSKLFLVKKVNDNEIKVEEYKDPNTEIKNKYIMVDDKKLTVYSVKDNYQDARKLCNAYNR